MALEGNLTAFGLSEILQLIAVQQKTGMLTISTQEGSTVMFFRNGAIISTRDRRRRARDPFKEYLTRYGILNREELIRITQIASQSKLDLTEILGSEGFLSEEELRTHFHKQIQETMHDVLTWEQCTYKFISNEDIVSDVKTVGEYNVEAMLMESMRRIDEFPQMLSMFPHDGILVTRVEGEDEPDDEDVTQNEKTILGLLDDIVSLRDLIATAKMPLFEVYEALKLLKDKGRIKTKDEEPDAIDDDAAPTRKSARQARRNPLPLVAALVVLAGAVAFGSRGFIADFDPQQTIDLSIDESSSRARFEERLRWSIEAYRAQNGAYPRSLETLESTGLGDRLVERAASFGLRYKLTPGSNAYTLF